MWPPPVVCETNQPECSQYIDQFNSILVLHGIDGGIFFFQALYIAIEGAWELANLSPADRDAARAGMRYPPTDEQIAIVRDHYDLLTPALQP